MSLTTESEQAQLRILFEQHPKLFNVSSDGALYLGLIAAATALLMILWSIWQIANFKNSDGKPSVAKQLQLCLPTVLFFGVAIGTIVSCYGNDVLVDRAAYDFEGDKPSADFWLNITGRYNTTDVTELGRMMLSLLFAVFVTFFGLGAAMLYHKYDGALSRAMFILFGSGLPFVFTTGALMAWNPRRQFDERNGLVDGR